MRGSVNLWSTSGLALLRAGMMVKGVSGEHRVPVLICWRELWIYAGWRNVTMG